MTVVEAITSILLCAHRVFFSDHFFFGIKIYNEYLFLDLLYLPINAAVIVL